MSKLTIDERLAAMDKLQDELQEAIGRAPRGLTDDEIDSCWQDAKEYWQPEREACLRIQQNGSSKNT